MEAFRGLHSFSSLKCCVVSNNAGLFYVLTQVPWSPTMQVLL